MNFLKYSICTLLISLAIPIVESHILVRDIRSNRAKVFSGKCEEFEWVNKVDGCIPGNKHNYMSDGVSVIFEPDGHSITVTVRGAREEVDIVKDVFNNERFSIDKHSGYSLAAFDKPSQRHNRNAYLVFFIHVNELVTDNLAEQIRGNFGLLMEELRLSRNNPNLLLKGTKLNENITYELGILFAIIMGLLLLNTLTNRAASLMPTVNFFLTLTNLLSEKYSRVLQQERIDMHIEYNQFLTEGEVGYARYIVVVYYLGIIWSVIKWAMEGITNLVKILPKQN